MSDYNENYSKSVITSLDRSDKSIIASFVILAFGFFALLAPAVNTPVKLPGGIFLTNIQQAVSVILAIHFLNGMRYFFYLRRATNIAKNLPKSLSNALSSHPSFATSSAVTETFQTEGLMMLTAPLLYSVNPTIGWWGLLVVAFLINQPFVSGAVLAHLQLDYKPPTSKER